MKAAVKNLRVTQTSHTELWAPRGLCRAVSIVSAGWKEQKEVLECRVDLHLHTPSCPSYILLTLSRPLHLPDLDFRSSANKRMLSYHLRELPGKQFHFSCVAGYIYLFYQVTTVS